MRYPVLLSLVALFVPFALSAGQDVKATLPGSNVAWDLDSTSAKIDDHLGRSALFLRGQDPAALASGVEFADGTIEFDLSPLSGGNFVGLVWRYASRLNHENIYFRLHRSGSFEAVQYAPRINGSGGTWQLYAQYMATAQLPPNTWTHVRAEIRGSGLELFVGDSSKPLLIVPRMRGTSPTGRVGFWGRVNDQPREWTAAISNVQIRPRTATPLVAVDTSALPAGSLTGWQIAGPFEATDTARLAPMPRVSAWAPIRVEEGGLVNISRHLQKPAGGRHVVLLRNMITVPSDRSAALEIGYSDDAIVWLNGTPIFRGLNGLGSRYPGFLGVIATPAEYVYLPLRAGDNELIIGVAERIAGWGLKARLVP
jgi:hypothetical protein